MWEDGTIFQLNASRTDFLFYDIINYVMFLDSLRHVFWVSMALPMGRCA